MIMFVKKNWIDNRLNKLPENKNVYTNYKCKKNASNSKTKEYITDKLLRQLKKKERLNQWQSIKTKIQATRTEINQQQIKKNIYMWKICNG